MLGHLRFLLVTGSSLLALGLALLVVAPQAPRREQPARPLRALGRPSPAPKPMRLVQLDVAPDPSLDLYELSGLPAFRVCVQ